MRIGVASAAIGLLTAALGLPDRIAAALGGAPADQAARTALEAAKPRLDVRYVLISLDLHLDGRPSVAGTGEDTARANAARSFLSLPVVQTEAGDQESELAIPDTTTTYQIPHTAYLLVRNVGGRGASAVTLRADRLPLDGAVPVREAAVGGDDYAAVLRGRASGAARIGVEVPQTLEPGEGVLIPIFRGTTPAARGGAWWVISPVALLPDSLSFTDALLGTATAVPVRRMANPMVVADGVVGRG